MLPGSFGADSTSCSSTRTGGPGGGGPNKDPFIILLLVVLTIFSLLVSFNISMNT